MDHSLWSIGYGGQEYICIMDRRDMRLLVKQIYFILYNPNKATTFFGDRGSVGWLYGVYHKPYMIYGIWLNNLAISMSVVVAKSFFVHGCQAHKRTICQSFVSTGKSCTVHAIRRLNLTSKLELILVPSFRIVYIWPAILVTFSM